ncbi:hypothetical protein Sjap_025312 [Stephania japonica]|uniref:Protein kinase domain-containing protein n=1 Tax=Stephania japonica TaxID=461633 RepID=A0AAP0HHU7_9MAGN
MAPEYAMEGIYSIKSDVFSFGVLLLEIVSGKRNYGFHLPRRPPSLLAYAWELWSEEKELELVDPLIVESCSKVELSRCVHVGLLCVQEDPTERPTMASVVVMLLGNESLVLPQPHQSAFFGGRVACQPDQLILSYDILRGNSNVSSCATS